MKPTKQNTMETFRLISMTDFLLEHKNPIGFKSEIERLTYYNTVYNNYARFLKQPLKLEMFVPCDENGNVLDTSDAFKSCEKGFLYGKAKERVLFKGFRLIANSNIPRIENGHCVIFLEDIAKMKIEDLLQKWEALELTENAIKQI